MWGAWIASWVPLLWLARSLGPAPASVKRRRSRRPQIEEARSGAGQGGEALQRRVEAARLGPRLGVVGRLVLARTPRRCMSRSTLAVTMMVPIEPVTVVGCATIRSAASAM